MALLVLASCLYRLMARRLRGYDDAQARQILAEIGNEELAVGALSRTPFCSKMRGLGYLLWGT
jgi:hypothetical protein